MFKRFEASILLPTKLFPWTDHPVGFRRVAAWSCARSDHYITRSGLGLDGLKYLDKQPLVSSELKVTRSSCWGDFLT